MIRLAFMTDKARVIGFKRFDDNSKKRLKFLPKGLPGAMSEILRSENVAI